MLWYGCKLQDFTLITLYKGNEKMCQLKRLFCLSTWSFTGLILLLGILVYTRQNIDALEVYPSVTPTIQLAVRIESINLTTQDILYDSMRDLLYASIPSTAGNMADRIAVISVPTGTIETSIFVGNSPNRLAISADNSYLYTGLDSAGAVRRVNLISQTAELQFSLGSGSCGTFLAEDMVVLQDDPHAIAISQRNSGCSPRHEGVAIYDDGVRRPETTPRHTGSNHIEPSSYADTLYGFNSETTEHGFRVMSVYSTGITVTSVTDNLISGHGVTMHYANDFIYASSGAVVDPNTLTLVGTYDVNTDYRSLVVPDVTSGRAYFLNFPFPNGLISLQVFDLDTFSLIDEIELPEMTGRPLRMVQIGPNLLAVSTDENKLYFLEVVDLIESVFLPINFKDYCPGLDYFMDDFSNPASGWLVDDNDFVRSAYINDEYQVYTKQSGYFFLFRAPTCERENFVVEVDVRWEGETGNSYGLLFGITEGFQQYYLFDINSDYQMYRLLRRDPGGFTQLVPPTMSSAIHPGANSNHLAVTRNGGAITLAINGSTLGTWYDYGIVGKTDVGLVTSAYNSDPTSDARFDNFQVVRLKNQTNNIVSTPVTPITKTVISCTFTTTNSCREPFLDISEWLDR